MKHNVKIEGGPQREDAFNLLVARRINNVFWKVPFIVSLGSRCIFHPKHLAWELLLNQIRSIQHTLSPPYSRSASSCVLQERGSTGDQHRSVTHPVLPSATLFVLQGQCALDASSRPYVVPSLIDWWSHSFILHSFLHLFLHPTDMYWVPRCARHCAWCWHSVASNSHSLFSHDASEEPARWLILSGAGKPSDQREGGVCGGRTVPPSTSISSLSILSLLLSPLPSTLPLTWRE